MSHKTKIFMKKINRILLILFLQLTIFSCKRVFDEKLAKKHFYTNKESFQRLVDNLDTNSLRYSHIGQFISSDIAPVDKKATNELSIDSIHFFAGGCNKLKRELHYEFICNSINGKNVHYVINHCDTINQKVNYRKEEKGYVIIGLGDFWYLWYWK